VGLSHKALTIGIIFFIFKFNICISYVRLNIDDAENYGTLNQLSVLPDDTRWAAAIYDKNNINEDFIQQNKRQNTKF
jgi:hypothetical protein